MDGWMAGWCALGLIALAVLGGRAVVRACVRACVRVYVCARAGVGLHADAAEDIEKIQ